ncbi:MAG: hypothetical protein P8183_20670 [Anaerolineae bacterium]|jgi:ribosomal protein S20
MLNPYQKPEDELKKRARQHMENKSIRSQIKTLVEGAFVEFLRNESVVLTRNEKYRLYQTVVREMFDDILAGLSKKDE